MKMVFCYNASESITREVKVDHYLLYFHGLSLILFIPPFTSSFSQISPISVLVSVCPITWPVN